MISVVNRIAFHATPIGNSKRRALRRILYAAPNPLHQVTVVFGIISKGDRLNTDTAQITKSEQPLSFLMGIVKRFKRLANV
ncbi:hypothetical protein BCHO_0854 [Bifidobacterium choerinum]|uniref:Uncharacterized protein n=1 Tax=Bifidobacterium choerinum TaxID=35760 RepID=A0A087AF85_9BIFI|nr:hypothetical protein BCHO_0854 [Bifidobacterium choerinum]